MLPAASPTSESLLWDVFCRVIDNFGDIGVCWRAAANLGARGQRVRLWVDDPGALAWMAPDGAAGVSVARWHAQTQWPEPGDVVVEAFGCDPPDDFVARMACRPEPPLWINLEYLSAEDYVERSHRLRSPQWRSPANGMDKWFFYPGFTPATGGLLREAGLVERSTHRPVPWGTLGVTPQPGECCISLFCYPGAPLASLLQARAGQPTLLLTAPGAATQALQGLALPKATRTAALPWLTQPDYDALLAHCDLNLVRGEDSFVRAQWAARPFLWHIYPQEDGVHADKLDAFLRRHLRAAPAALTPTVQAWMRHWNGLAAPPAEALPALSVWAAHNRNWRDELMTQPDLVTQLLGFVAEKR